MDTSALGQRAPAPVGESLRQAWQGKADNIVRAWQHFEAKETRLDSMPFIATVELTQNCNFKCIMCAQSMEAKYAKYNPDYNMPMELFVKISRELFPAAINVDLRGFGETTILPYWPEVVDSLESYPWIEWNLVTNLSLNRDDVWDKMIRCGFVLGFSCDGGTKEIFEGIRVGSNFEKTRYNLGLIRDLRHKHGRGFIYMISTIQRKNAAHMRSIVELAHEFEVAEVQFHIVQGGFSEGGVTHGFNVDFSNLGTPLISRYTTEALDAAIDLGVRVTFNDPIFTRGVDSEKIRRASAPIQLPPDPLSFFGADADGLMGSYAQKRVDSTKVSIHKRCFKPFSFLHIDHRGKMGPCNHMHYPDMPEFGDANHQTISELWNDARYQDFRRQLVTATPEDPRCQWCFNNRLSD